MSVKADEKHCTLGRLGFTSERGGTLAVVVGDTDTHPPASGGTDKLQHLGRLVASLEMIRQIGSGFFPSKGPYLHGPSTTDLERNGSL